MIGRRVWAGAGAQVGVDCWFAGSWFAGSWFAGSWFAGSGVACS